MISIGRALEEVALDLLDKRLDELDLLLIQVQHRRNKANWLKKYPGMMGSTLSPQEIEERQNYAEQMEEPWAVDPGAEEDPLRRRLLRAKALGVPLHVVEQMIQIVHAVQGGDLGELYREFLGGGPLA